MLSFQVDNGEMLWPRRGAVMTHLHVKDKAFCELDGKYVAEAGTRFQVA